MVKTTNQYIFHILGIITPTDFHIFQRGRAQPPTSYIFICLCYTSHVRYIKGALGRAAAAWFFRWSSPGSKRRTGRPRSTQVHRWDMSTFQRRFSRENFEENHIFTGKIDGFRLRFSLKPIHWRLMAGKMKNPPGFAENVLFYFANGKSATWGNM